MCLRGPDCFPEPGTGSGVGTTMGSPVGVGRALLFRNTLPGVSPRQFEVQAACVCPCLHVCGSCLCITSCVVCVTVCMWCESHFWPGCLSGLQPRQDQGHPKKPSCQAAKVPCPPAADWTRKRLGSSWSPELPCLCWATSRGWKSCIAPRLEALRVETQAWDAWVARGELGSCSPLGSGSSLGWGMR